MKKSVVGQYVDGLDFDKLSEEFVKWGMKMIRVRSMGDNLGLLTPREGENMEELIKLNRVWFDSLFVSLKPSTKMVVASHKVVWVKCYGLPISLWNEECFRIMIGESVKLMSIDKSTLMWDNMEFTQIQVRIENHRYVRLVKKMRINEHMLSILLEEDHPVSTADCCNGHLYNHDSSDNVSSFETYVEESSFSKNSGEEENNHRDGEELRSKGKVVGGREEVGGDWKVQMSKASFGASS